MSMHVLTKLALQQLCGIFAVKQTFLYIVSADLHPVLPIKTRLYDRLKGFVLIHSCIAIDICLYMSVWHL